MGLLSTILLLATGCSAHLGALPAEHAWRVSAVEAPVAEPGIDDAVRASVLAALNGRGALGSGEGAGDLRLTVVEASWMPTRRSADVLLYEARLAVSFEGRDATGQPIASVRRGVRTVIDPGDAAAGRALREEAFDALARQVAEDGVAWLLSR